MRAALTLLLVGCLLTACKGPDAAAAPASRAPVPVKTAASVNDCMLKHAKETLSRYDVDKNGTLSEAEFADGSNGDIRYGLAPTEAEVARMRQGFVDSFHRLDTNPDGQMTTAELAPNYEILCHD
jgi:hypothetical protein